jgi:hypothetical protein
VAPESADLALLGRVAESIKGRIERSLPREPIFRKPMVDNVLATGFSWARTYPLTSRGLRNACGRGIAALEDKVVQQAVVTVLNQTYEKDFLGFSYGFRPVWPLLQLRVSVVEVSCKTFIQRFDSGARLQQMILCFCDLGLPGATRSSLII